MAKNTTAGGLAEYYNQLIEGGIPSGLAADLVRQAAINIDEIVLIDPDAR